MTNSSNQIHQINSKVRHYDDDCIGIIVSYTSNEEVDEKIDDVWCNVKWIWEDGKDVEWTGLEHQNNLIKLN